MLKVKVSFKSSVQKDLDKKLKLLEESLRENTPVDTGRARDGWHIANGNLVNPVEYIDRLNEGSSTQAPAHFVEKTLLSHQGVNPSGTIVRSL